MQDMTPEQREEFIKRRVKEILDAYEVMHKTIDAMTFGERDAYVHSRVERDLAVSEAIEYRQAQYVEHQARYIESSKSLWNQILESDIIALMILAWVALHDLPDAIGFLAVVAAMGISRYMNHIRNKRAEQLHKEAELILDLNRAFIVREIDTATLGFLINSVRQDALNDLANTVQGMDDAKPNNAA